jgi:hypothetical protein
LISCRSTQLVVNQARLLHQVLLGKAQHLQARPDYRHGRGTEDAGNVYQSTLGGRFLLRLGATASSAATVAGAAPSYAPAATTSSVTAATGSVLP